MTNRDIVKSIFAAVAMLSATDAWADEWADSYTGRGAKNAEMGA